MEVEYQQMCLKDKLLNYLTEENIQIREWQGKYMNDNLH